MTTVCYVVCVLLHTLMMITVWICAIMLYVYVTCVNFANSCCFF